MKGLIIKDLYTFLGQGRQLFIFLMIFVICFSFQDATAIIPMFTVIASMWVLNTFHYDENCKWLSFAFSSPYTRMEIALSKYVIAIPFTFAGPVIGFISSSLGNFITGKEQDIFSDDIMTICVVSLFIAVFCISIAIPAYFKFGAVTGRIVVMGVYLVLTLAITWGALSTAFLSKAMAFAMENEDMIPVFLAVAAVVMMSASMAVSLAVIKKKEV